VCVCACGCGHCRRRREVRGSPRRSPLRAEHTLGSAGAAPGAAGPGDAAGSVRAPLPLAPLAAAAAEECFCSLFPWRKRVTQVKAEKGGLFL